MRSLTGYSKSSFQTSSQVNGGYLTGKEEGNIDSNIQTLVRIYVMANKLSTDFEL